VAVASAGPYASLHLAPDRQPHRHPTTQFFTGRMPFLPPNQQRQSTEGQLCYVMRLYISCCRQSLTTALFPPIFAPFRLILWPLDYWSKNSNNFPLLQQHLQHQRACHVSGNGVHVAVFTVVSQAVLLRTSWLHLTVLKVTVCHTAAYKVEMMIIISRVLQSL